MSVFRNDRSRSKDVAVETLIGRSTVIRGDVLFTGGLHVDGQIKGKVIASTGSASTLSISESGSIEGDISVPTLVVNGSVSGNVYVKEKMTLTPNARVIGNVFYNALELQVGAEVQGHLVFDPSGERTPGTMQPGIPEPAPSTPILEQYVGLKSLVSS